MNSKLVKILASLSILALMSGCNTNPDDTYDGSYDSGSSKYNESSNKYNNDTNGYGNDANGYGQTANGYGNNNGMVGMDSLGQGANAGGNGIGQLASNAGGLPISQLMPNNGGGSDDSQGSSGGHARFYPQGLLKGNIEGNRFVMSSVLDMKQQVYPSNFQLNPEDNATYLITIAGYDVREDRLIESSGYILFQFVMPDIRTTGVYDVIYPPSANNARVTVDRVEDFNDRYEIHGYLDNAEFYYMDSNNTYKMSVEFNIDKGLLQVKPPQQ